MEKITKQAIIDNVPKFWEDEYRHTNNAKQKAITERLKTEKPKTESEVTAIIGNNTWTRNKCDECHEDVDATVYLGDPDPMEEGYGISLCQSCLSKALKLIKQK